MATTRQGGKAWLLLCATVALAATAQAQQATQFQGFPNYSFGRCPSYQTSAEFTQEFIDQQLITLEDGYILGLSDGSADSCQKLKFLDEDTFKYSYSDIANRSRTYSSTYTATLANLTTPAQIKLNLVIGMLGADIFGRLSLIPLVVDANKLVLASCSQLGAIKSEQLLVFLPYPSTANVSAIKEELVAGKIPNAGRLAEISQECGPVSVRSPQPLPLRFYNLISALNNPARLTQNSVGSIRSPGIFTFNRVNQGLLRSGLEVDETENALPQTAENSVPFVTSNFEVPVFYNFQQPFVSTFASGFPAGAPYYAPDAQGVTYTAAAHGVAGSSYYQGKFPNEIYSQFYSQGK